MAMSQPNPNMAVNVDIDYWSITPQIRKIEWSNLKCAWIAHLFDDETGLIGAMEVCLDCVTVHVYQYCDGSGMHRFEPCDTNIPVYHLLHIDKHYNLEPNNKYVREAIERTPHPRWVSTLPHGIIEWRGYKPKVTIHRRHIGECSRGSSPEYIIQGSGGLSKSIYYRRCDGKFRNLAHQILKMGTGDESLARATVQTAKKNDHVAERADQAMDLDSQSMAITMATVKETQLNDSRAGNIYIHATRVDLFPELADRVEMSKKRKTQVEAQLET